MFLKRLHPLSENAGIRIVAEIEVGGTPSPSVFWFKDGIPVINKPGHIKIHQHGPCHTLIIANANVSSHIALKSHSNILYMKWRANALSCF